MDGSGVVLMVETSAFIVMPYRQALCSRKLRMKMMRKEQLLLRSL